MVEVSTAIFEASTFSCSKGRHRLRAKKAARVTNGVPNRQTFQPATQGPLEHPEGRHLTVIRRIYAASSGGPEIKSLIINVRDSTR